MACKFINHFEEPKKKYICLTASLFYKDLYIKVNPRNLQPVDKTMEKVNMFYRNLKKILVLLNDYPDNIYLRLYYDKTVYKVKIYEILFKELKKNPRVQLVEFECEYFKNNREDKNTDFHMNLFGTLIRFFPIFDNSSKKMEYYVSIDLDNHYLPPFLEMLQEFIASGNLVGGLSKITQIAFHSNDYKEFDYFNFTYLIANCIMVKKHKMFKPIYWEKYFNNMYEQYDLMYIFNYIDFKRFGLNPILENVQLKSESYYSFNYGADEIWINHILKKILIDNKSKDKLYTYITNDNDMSVLSNRLINMLQYNSIINVSQFKLFLKECNSLYKECKIQNKDTYVKYINNLKTKEDYLKCFNELTSNKFFNRLYIQNNIKYIICNYKELISKQRKYTYNNIVGRIY